MGFGLGQEVKTLQTGIPAEGMIVSANHPLFWKAQASQRGGTFEKWDELYPDWANKPVYAVLLKKPQKPITFKEFSDGMKKRGMDDIFEIKKKYDAVEDQQVIMYPEDDIIALTKIPIDENLPL